MTPRILLAIERAATAADQADARLLAAIREAHAAGYSTRQIVGATGGRIRSAQTVLNLLAKEGEK
jgi:hypothetical protein